MNTTHRMRITDRLTAAERKSIKRAAALHGITARTLTHGCHGSTLAIDSEDIGSLMDVGDVALSLGVVGITIDSVERTIVDPEIGSYRERCLNSSTYIGRDALADAYGLELPVEAR